MNEPLSWAGTAPHRDVLLLLGAWDEKVAIFTVRANNAAEAVCGVADAGWQHLAAQESIDDRALPVAGAAKEGYLHEQTTFHSLAPATGLMCRS